MNLRRNRNKILAAGAAVVLLGIGVASVAGGGGGGSGGDDSLPASQAGGREQATTNATRGSQSRLPDAAPAPPADALEMDGSLASLDTGYSTARTPVERANMPRRPEQPNDPLTPSLIRTGTVELRSDDVTKARFDVQKVVDRYSGEVAEESSEADKQGAAQYARLVIRVPVGDFDAAMTDLRKVATLISTNTNTDDVTTKVIDTDVRVRLQRRSIDRISVLLDRARNIRDIVNIESELSRREAELGSLEKRQAYLRNQTSLSTITVSLERPAKEKKAVVHPKKKDDHGFLTGLEDGWRALSHLTVGGLQVGGAILPFAVLLLVLGVPLWLFRRRLRTTPDQPAAATQST